MPFELTGTEATSLELVGSVDEEATAVHLSDLVPLCVDGRVEVSLLLFHMTGLRFSGAPGPSFDYREALWRIGVVFGGEASWLVVRGVSGHIAVRASAARLARSP